MEVQVRVEEAAKHALQSVCDEHFEGLSVLFTDSVVMRHIPKRRAVTREKEQRRLSAVVSEVVADLQRTGTVASADVIAESAGFADSTWIVQGYQRLISAVSERLKAGDNAWADVSLPGADVIILHFWHDKSHR
jgi:hypothetical protein